MFGKWFKTGKCDTSSKGYSNKKFGWDKGHNDKFDFGKCFDKKKFSWDRSEDKKIDCGFNKSKHHDRDHSDKDGGKCDLWGSSKHFKCWDKKIDCSKFSFKGHDHDKAHTKIKSLWDKADKSGCGETEAAAPVDNPIAAGPPVTGTPCDCETDGDKKAEAPAPKAPAIETCDAFQFVGHISKKIHVAHDHKDLCDIDFSWVGHLKDKASKIDLWECDEIVLPKCEIPEIETKCWSFDFQDCFSFC